MTAKSVVDVILGEAKAGDKEDMLAIASVIENRARALGVTPEQVVQVQSEFNAYGRPIPPGNDKHRDMAVAALEQVRTSGPVIEATFYATPKAKGNLPKGLQKVGSTSGHVFFNDPKMRSIKTTEGFKRPSFDRIQVANETATPRAKPDRTAAAIETAFAPTGTIDQSPFDALFSDAPAPASPAVQDDIYSYANQYQAPQNYGRSATRKAQPIETAVMHHTVIDDPGKLQSVVNTARSPGEFLGYHFGVQPNTGIINQFAPLDVRTNHVGAVSAPPTPSGIQPTNRNSLAVSLMGIDDRPTGAALASTAKMVRDLNDAGVTNIGRGGFGYHGKGAANYQDGTSNVEGKYAADILNEAFETALVGPRTRSRVTGVGSPVADRPAGYVSASDLDSLTLGELGADIGRDRRSGFGNGLALDNSMAAAMPAGHRATSGIVNTPTTVGGSMEALGAPAQAAPRTQSAFDTTFDLFDAPQAPSAVAPVATQAIPQTIAQAGMPSRDVGAKTVAEDEKKRGGMGSALAGAAIGSLLGVGPAVGAAAGGYLGRNGLPSMPNMGGLGELLGGFGNMSMGGLFTPEGFAETPRGQVVGAMNANPGMTGEEIYGAYTRANNGVGVMDAGEISRIEAERNRAGNTRSIGSGLSEALSEAFGGLF